METEMKEKTVGELVAEDYRTADVFKHYGIDFCCGGKKPLSKVCDEKGIDRTKLETDLLNLSNTGKIPSQNFDQWEIDFLIDYILNTHHAYINRSIPVMTQYIEKVARVHGHAYTETVTVLELWNEIVADLTSHMMKEEQVLFPYIKQLMQANRQHSKLNPPPFATVKNPVYMMEHEHDAVGKLVKEIQRITDNYSTPPEACNTYKVSYAKLNEFAEDLFMHIHLENNILFPKAIQLERNLKPEMLAASV